MCAYPFLLPVVTMHSLIVTVFSLDIPTQMLYNPCESTQRLFLTLASFRSESWFVSTSVYNCLITMGIEGSYFGALFRDALSLESSDHSLCSHGFRTSVVLSWQLLCLPALLPGQQLAG